MVGSGFLSGSWFNLFKEVRATFLESFEVAEFIVSGVFFPTTEHDADTLKSHGSYCGRMFFTLFDQLVIVGLGPEGVADRLIGILLEALSQKLWAGVAPMDPRRVSTAFGHRSHTAVHLELLSGIIAGAIRTEGG